MTSHSSPTLQRMAVKALMPFDFADRAVCGYTRADASVQEAIRISKTQALINLQRVGAQGTATGREFEALRQIILRRPN